ncbi:helix-turn-helix transcriptional regulator [Nocardiopsis sp. NPDC049922]|uniref:PadR family transcriptional regulator n=1 Tax=Nocardiopsis sp. NPDC049922 TaxID=3155157 RepID=UPI0033D9AA60
MDDVKITVSVAAVLRAFLEDTGRHRFGYDLMKDTSLKSGTLYPILARLQKAGWIESEWEDIDEKAEGRPARRFYQLNPDGAAAARVALAELHERLGVQSTPALGLSPLGGQA